LDGLVFGGFFRKRLADPSHIAAKDIDTIVPGGTNLEAWERRLALELKRHGIVPGKNQEGTSHIYRRSPTSAVLTAYYQYGDHMVQVQLCDRNKGLSIVPDITANGVHLGRTKGLMTSSAQANITDTLEAIWTQTLIWEETPGSLWKIGRYVERRAKFLQEGFELAGCTLMERCNLDTLSQEDLEQLLEPGEMVPSDRPPETLRLEIEHMKGTHRGDSFYAATGFTRLSVSKEMSSDPSNLLNSNLKRGRFSSKNPKYRSVHPYIYLEREWSTRVSLLSNIARGVLSGADRELFLQLVTFSNFQAGKPELQSLSSLVGRPVEVFLGFSPEHVFAAVRLSPAGASQSLEPLQVFLSVRVLPGTRRLIGIEYSKISRVLEKSATLVSRAVDPSVWAAYNEVVQSVKGLSFIDLPVLPAATSHVRKSKGAVTAWEPHLNMHNAALRASGSDQHAKLLHHTQSGTLGACLHATTSMTAVRHVLNPTLVAITTLTEDVMTLVGLHVRRLLEDLPPGRTLPAAIFTLPFYRLVARLVTTRGEGVRPVWRKTRAKGLTAKIVEEVSWTAQQLWDRTQQRREQVDPSRVAERPMVLPVLLYLPLCCDARLHTLYTMKHNAAGEG
jgi:hypothetical protein